MASATTKANRWDAAFVVNRLIEPSRIAAICRENDHRRILVLSAHRFFPGERSIVGSEATIESADYVTFGDWLNDSALAAIDDAASATLLAKPPRLECYVARFQALMTRRKNDALLAEMRQRGPAGRLYTSHGLGIDAAVWSDAGARLLVSVSWKERCRQTALWRAASSAKNAFSRQLRPQLPPTGALLRDGATRYLFTCPLKRLALRPETSVTEVPLTREYVRQADFVATTIHDHRHDSRRLGLPIVVFTDSYLPSNYPRTYLDGYGDVSFASADPFSARWLTRFDRRLIPTPTFLQIPHLPAARSPSALNTIVLLLNHAGDWSALINRSDTDSLVWEFSQLARRLPKTNFVIRVHPGMDDANHEGAGARARLAAFARADGPVNLSVSTATLADDLARGDLFLSEYSTTMISAWQLGKIGIIANLTGRRSFMKDFSDLGFVEVSTATTLYSTVETALDDASILATAQSAAALRYNSLVAAFVVR